MNNNNLENWCGTCSNIRNDGGSTCTICGANLESRPFPSGSNQNSIAGSADTDDTLHASNVLDPVIDNIQIQFLYNLGLNLRTFLHNDINTASEQSTSSSKATSKAFLKQIPRIVINEKSSILNDVIVEFSVPSSYGGNSSNTDAIMQFDASTAEFGPSPPYEIAGNFRSFLHREQDMKSLKGTKGTSSDDLKVDPCIAYMMRGNGITFVERAIYAQKQGAKALIIANHVDVWPYIMQDSKNALAQSKIPLRIPVVMIKKSDHAKLAQYLPKMFDSNPNGGVYGGSCISCRIHAKNKGEDDDHDLNACIICREQFQISDTVMRLPFCFHTFHESCALLWLKKHNTCPCCRRELPMENQEKENERRRMGRSYAGNYDNDTISDGASLYG